MKKKLGVIVNPIAGLGGRVGLKGTDGADMVDQARRLGAVPEAPGRATEALKRMAPSLRRATVEVLAAPGEMGADEVAAAGISREVVGSAAQGATSAEDTRSAARAMAERGVDLLLFAGGDGTARDVFEAVGDRVVALGIPAGVKMHSGVYSTTPQAAALLATHYLTGEGQATREVEVMDIDEDAFRSGALSAKLHGYLTVPDEPLLLQGTKDGARADEQSAQEAVSEGFADRVEKGVAYVLGPGTTTRAIARRLGVEKTLLGVDVVLDGDVIARDATEAEVLDATVGRPARIVVTPIGGQGHIFGRGNQQISPAVVEQVGRDKLIVVSTPEKLAGLRGSPLLVDTGDAALDAALGGFASVITGYRTETVYRVGGVTP